MKIAVIGDREMATGFMLAGLDEVYEIKSSDEAIDIIKKLDTRKDIGLIITSEKIGEDIRDKVTNVKKFIVEIPDKNGAIVREHDPIKTLVRKAVGVELK